MVAKSCNVNYTLGKLPCAESDEVHCLVVFYAKEWHGFCCLIKLQTYREMTMRSYDVAKCFSLTVDIRMNKSCDFNEWL